MSKRENLDTTIHSLEELGSYMQRQNMQLPVKAINEYVNEKQENISESIEDKVESIVEGANEVLDDVSGIPGAKSAEGYSVEPTNEIEEISKENSMDQGVLAEEDKRERVAQLSEVVEEIEKIDNQVDALKDEGASSVEIKPIKNVRKILTEKTKEIIRETSPELLSLINKEDVEIILEVESLLDSVKDKKSIKEKIFELKKNHLITDKQLSDFNKARLARSAFMLMAEEQNIPSDISRIIYRSDKEFIDSIKLSEKEENNIEKAVSEIIPHEVEEKSAKEIEWDKRRSKFLAVKPEKLQQLRELHNLYEQKISDAKTDKEREIFTNVLKNLDERIEIVLDEENEGDIEEDTGTIIHEYDKPNVEIELETEKTMTEAQVEKIEELIGIYNSCLSNTISVKNEKERTRFIETLDNLRKQIEEISSNKYKDIDNTLIITRSVAKDIERNINYELGIEQSKEEFIGGVEAFPTRDEVIKDESKEAEEPKVEVKEVKEHPLTAFEKRLKKIDEKMDNCREIAETFIDDNAKMEVFDSINKLENNINKLSVDQKMSDENKLIKVNNYIKNLLDDVHYIFKDSKDKAGENAILDSALSASREVEDNGKIEYRIGKKESTKAISSRVAEEYEKLGIGLDALKELEGFSDLSGGQQLLMLKNYNSALLGKVRTESKEEADREWSKNTKSGKLGRVGLSIITLGTAKTFREKRKQKEVAKRLISGDNLGFENRQAMLQSLVEVAKECPPVHLEKDGNLQIEYIDSNDFSEIPEAYEIIRNYNEAASRYASIPRSWFDNNISFKDNEKEGDFFAKLLGGKRSLLSGKENLKLSDAREEYNKAREDYIKLMLEDIGDTAENRKSVMKELNGLDERVKMNQLFSSDPNAQQLLQDIKDSNVFNQTLGEFISKRGQYMAYGSILRFTAVATVSSLAAPIGVAMVAGMGYLRGKREARDMLKMKRASGALTEKDLSEEVVYNVNLEQRLANLVEGLEEASKSDDKEYIQGLRAEITEISHKIKSGYTIERRTRKLGEFRDAKFYSDRVENLVTKYEMLKGTEGQEKEAALVEHKIAQTAVLMRELMNNNMLNFAGDGSIKTRGKRETRKDIVKNGDARSVLNRLSFIQALSLADTTVSLDTAAIEKKMADIVGIRRDRVDQIDNKKSIQHITKAVSTSVVFAGAGYALSHLGAEYFGESDHHSIENGIYSVEKGDNLDDIMRSNIKALSGVSGHVQDNAMANFVNRLTIEQLKDIGITNPHKIIPGQHINLEKLEEYFNSMRINGKSLVERATHVSGGKAAVESYISEGNGNYVEQEGEDVLMMDVDNEVDVVENNQPEAKLDDSLVGRQAVDVNIEHVGDVSKIESSWDSLSLPEKIDSIDTLIPEYISDQIGEVNNAEFLANAKNISANELSNPLGTEEKVRMLEVIKKVLGDRGITPEKGFNYTGNLYDYVMQSYRVKIMTVGLNAVK